MGTYYSYNCQSCGIREYMQSKVRRCNFCGITLCRRCKQGGVCPRDYMILLPKERAKLAQTSYLIENGCGCSIGTCFLTLLVCLSFGLTYAFGIAIFVMISISVGFIVGGKNAKKQVIADILTRLNAELHALKQNGFGHQDPVDPFSPFPPSTDFIQPPSRIPQTSYIPPPAGDMSQPLDYPTAIPSSTARQPVPAASKPNAKICGACGAQLLSIDGEMPAFCSNCGTAVN
nr:hypothetical protein [Candidatus Sigynarchaeum springense]